MDSVESRTRAATHLFTVTGLARHAKQDEWRTGGELLGPTSEPGSNNVDSLFPPTLITEPPHFFRPSGECIFIFQHTTDLNMR